jgi:hypothetical protein
MESRYLELLRRFDDPREWECPPDFPWEEEIARVRAVRPRLEEALGQELVLDDQVQDAAHFAELGWSAVPAQDLRSGSYVIRHYVAIRFSSFGRLATVWGNVPEAPVSTNWIGRF